MRTRTGAFRIGFREGWSDWQKDRASAAAWAGQAGFEMIDLGAVSPDIVQTVKAGGVEVLSVDLYDWPTLLSTDPGKRKASIEKNASHFKVMTDLGVKIFFAVIIPEDPDRSGRENFALAVESFGALAEVAASLGATIALEGWPGGPPHYPNLCCNPETCRAMFKEVPSPGIGVNFDPSHLIRMGIDHTRFIDEFADRVRYVHAKDTEILADNLYEVGLYQHSIFSEPVGFGEFAWRYTIPGHGITRWSYCFDVLKQAGFSGGVSVELEDGNYNGSEAGEKAGLEAALAYLQTV